MTKCFTRNKNVICSQIQIREQNKAKGKKQTQQDVKVEEWSPLRFLQILHACDVQCVCCRGVKPTAQLRVQSGPLDQSPKNKGTLTVFYLSSTWTTSFKEQHSYAIKNNCGTFITTNVFVIERYGNARSDKIIILQIVMDNLLQSRLYINLFNFS